MQNQSQVVNSNVTTTVVSNDTNQAATAAVNIHLYAESYLRIETLAFDRESWEQGALRTSNEQLYELLAKCYAMYGEMCGKTEHAKSLQNALRDYIAKKGYSFTRATHTLTKIVKCVFGVERRRVSTYSLVLREVLSQKLSASDVSAFIVSRGGVEEIRRSKSANAKTPKQKAEMGKQAVSSIQLAVVNSDKIAEMIDAAKAGDDMVAIVTQQADGSLIVRALVNSQTVLNAALASVYSQNKGVVQTDIKNQLAANDADKLDNAIKLAVNG